MPPAGLPTRVLAAHTLPASSLHASHTLSSKASCTYSETMPDGLARLGAVRVQPSGTWGAEVRVGEAVGWAMEMAAAKAKVKVGEAVG